GPAPVGQGRNEQSGTNGGVRMGALRAAFPRTCTNSGGVSAMTKLSKSHLLATSAVAGLAILQLTPAAQAQDAFGVHNDQSGTLVVTVAEGETVEGEDNGVYADNGPVEVENGGTIRGNGTHQGSADTRPS